jgi:hypothetical protein
LGHQPSPTGRGLAGTPWSSRTSRESGGSAAAASRGDGDPQPGTASGRPRGHTSRRPVSAAADRPRRARGAGSFVWVAHCHRGSSRGFTVSGRQSRRAARLAPCRNVPRRQAIPIRLAVGPPRVRPHDPPEGTAGLRRGGSRPDRFRLFSKDPLEVPRQTRQSLVSEHAAAKRREDEQTDADPSHSITSSARASTAGGIVRPRALAIIARAGTTIGGHARSG